LHVLLIHQAFAALDEPGGTRHHELARYLAGKGHRVTVIASPVSYLTGAARAEGRPASPATAGAEDPDARVTILRAYTYTAFHRSFLHRVLSFISFMASSFFLGLRLGGVDLVWGTSPNIFQGLTAWSLARLKGVPFLFEVRDLWPAFAVQVGVLRQPALIRLSEWLERFLYRNADLVLVNSPGFVEHVAARGARRVELVPNGADIEMFHPEADGAAFRAAQLKDSMPAGAFLALYAGAHGLSNDLGMVLEAARLLGDRADIAFVLLGDGKEKDNLKRQAAGLGLQNVYFLPPVPKTEMPEALAAADACIAILKPLPLYATVYPNKVFDYMAAGRPVVLAIDGVIRQVVEEVGAGIFSPPGDAAALAEAVRWLADHPEKGREMGLNGRRCLETRFNRPLLAEKLACILEELAAEN
jgi:glycosyltransferase involved in cell wall biosynthesis